MRFPPAAPRRALPRAAAAAAIAAACMFGAAAPAFAAPDDAADPLANLLADKGLLASPAAPAQT
jgi:hypothetical protein